jgi:hypothetical protein
MMAEVKIKKFKFFFLILCIIQLFYIFHFRSGFKYEIIKNPFNESSGISYALSADVIESNSILKKQKAINFNLSESLKKDTYLYQRTIEFNYPIRIKESSKLVFFLNTEDIPNTCKIIETGKYLKLTKC